MYLRRVISKTLALSLRVPQSPATFRKEASLRQMSSSKFPGSSGSKMLYFLVVGVTVSAGGYYAYKTVRSKQSKYTDRMTNFKEKNKPKQQPLQGEEENPMEAEKASSEASKVSVLEAEVVGGEEISGYTDAVIVGNPVCPESVGTALMEMAAVGADIGPEGTDGPTGETTKVNANTSPGITKASPYEAVVSNDNSNDNSNNKDITKKESSDEHAELEKEISTAESGSFVEDILQEEPSVGSEGVSS
ncbi:PREDICTED: protein MGARP [Chrysochloris asiatica]|uniref:Protein MGARP n=1 Tax=Chrysochloris asiatica TaxID=185453 RepID=A0A9B0WYV0_CHRAS|nr:PREDICTED: protein MGARP [Chrysochloris asiatica]